MKPSGRTSEKLIDDLSTSLASAIIEALGAEEIDARVFNIQLHYHAVDNYWPYITMITEKEKDDAIVDKRDSLFIEGSPVANEILRENASGEFDEMFAEFDQYVQSKKAWDKGSELLIKTSRILTKNKLNGNVPVSNDFIVFATDWSMIPDADKIENVLIECGADRNNVKRWRDLNWF